MPRFLFNREHDRLMEEYGDYCLESILRGTVAKTFEEFREARP